MIMIRTPNTRTRTSRKSARSRAKARPNRQTFMAAKAKKWSAQVTKQSNAMDLEKGVFRQASAKKIARSLENSAARSKRRKSTPKRSAMSMLSFYVNRAGKNLSAAEKKKLERAKDELRKLAE